MKLKAPSFGASPVHCMVFQMAKHTLQRENHKYTEGVAEIYIVYLKLVALQILWKNVARVR